MAKKPRSMRKKRQDDRLKTKDIPQKLTLWYPLWDPKDLEAAVKNEPAIDGRWADHVTYAGDFELELELETIGKEDD